MHHVLRCGVDGTTIDFPGTLARVLGRPRPAGAASQALPRHLNGRVPAGVADCLSLPGDPRDQ
jgi:hypothetical protein